MHIAGIAGERRCLLLWYAVSLPANRAQLNQQIQGILGVPPAAVADIVQATLKCTRGGSFEAAA